MIRRMAFSLVPLVLVLAALEGLLRFVSDEAPLPRLSEMHQGTAMEGHPTRMWALRHDMETQFGAATRVRADGLREVVLTGADLRILTLGDSSIFGHALENDDTLHHALGQSLARRDVAVDVHCGGVPGYSTEQSLRLLEEVGWAVEPDLLVIGNLWSDNSYERFVDREWMALLDARWIRLHHVLSVSQAWQWLQHLRHPLPETDISEIPRVGWVKTPYEDGHRRVPVNEYAQNLDRMLAEAASRGAGAILLQPANRERLEQPWGWGWDVYFQAMTAVAEHRGVPVVDLVESLREAGLNREEAFLDRMHPSGRANGLYAERVAAALTAAGWPGTGLLPQEVEPFSQVFTDPGEAAIPLLTDPATEGAGDLP